MYLKCLRADKRKPVELRKKKAEYQNTTNMVTYLQYLTHGSRDNKQIPK